MRLKRFIPIVLLSYVIGFSVTTLLVYTSMVQRNPSALFLAFITVIFFTTFCGWWYFRGVREASLRVCAEWAAVWIAFFFFVDALLVVFWLDQSLTSIQPIAWAGYALEYIGLVVSAWLTRPLKSVPVEEAVESPNLRLSI